MESIIMKSYPDCGNDPSACFERYVREKIVDMINFKICHLNIEEFTDSHYNILKKISLDYNFNKKFNFYWNVTSRNVGTVKDSFVYSIDLYYKD